MPIKFRCPHCRQFLGISRSRANAVVDCPTCGRSLRVPSSDGKVEPLPAPKLDLKDSALASALDELAMIGREPVDTEPTGAEPIAPDREAAAPESHSVTMPLPLPEPISIDPPLPAERIEPASTAADIAAEPVPSSASLMDLLPPSEADKRFDAVSASPAGRRTVRGPVSLPMLLAAVVIGVGIFVAGYILGGRGKSSADSSVVQDQNNGKNRVNNGEARGESAAVNGRITYRTAGGESRPDVGGRVIVLPEQRTGTAKLSAVGLRPADADADLSLARAGLHALGGDVAAVDEQGNFSIRLSRAGTYHMLILSHHQARDETDETGDMATVQSVLEAYFDRPRSLLGHLRFHLESLRYSGSGTQPRDHTFERQP